MPPHSEQIVSRICGALFRGSLDKPRDFNDKPERNSKSSPPSGKLNRYSSLKFSLNASLKFNNDLSG
ncbi:hypothetical protein EBA05_16720 [Xanthomonas oryzae pv. oryzae]|nr:hypothetical protein C0L90_16665 [Xanthomonas oryzae pv. oryzae]QBI13272.1 hypothetical protein EYR02_16505 [Xanthomonas oryzae pv. oryzae]QBI16913.1 hypothetical protein EYR03_16925 [Xanthomonas oryzae pv. oryzae]QBN24193.1 hypothetical protein EBA00_05955 [Xanthomonas oryzae pv. oryzae]QBN31612.1 hypothetical protein EBA02_07390 [Xanthomonas oryzae pv. oryzae]